MTAATRYAQALFTLAQEGKQQAAVSAAATALSAAVEDATIHATLTNPRLTIAQRTQFAQAMAKAVKAPTVLASTFGLLATNNRLSVLPQVLASYAEKSDAAAGITHVKVATAATLTESQRTKLVSLVKAHTKSTDIRLDETLDPTLQGGFRAFFNGMVWDASLSGSMARLSTRLRATIMQR